MNWYQIGCIFFAGFWLAGLEYNHLKGCYDISLRTIFLYLLGIFAWPGAILLGIIGWIFDL